MIMLNVLKLDSDQVHLLEKSIALDLGNALLVANEYGPQAIPGCVREAPIPHLVEGDDLVLLSIEETQEPVESRILLDWHRSILFRPEVEIDSTRGIRVLWELMSSLPTIRL